MRSAIMYCAGILSYVTLATQRSNDAARLRHAGDGDSVGDLFTQQHLITVAEPMKACRTALSVMSNCDAISVRDGAPGSSGSNCFSESNNTALPARAVFVL